MTRTDGPLICDGCGETLTAQPGPDQQRPVPDNIARDVYGQEPGALMYVVCERGEACFTLAQLADELYDLARCRVDGCTGDRCDPPN